MRETASLVAPKSWSFEPTGRLVHLRWAVAEIAIGIETSSAGLDAAERALRIFCERAVTLLEAMDTDAQGLADACYTAELAIAEVRLSLAQSAQLRVERARLLHEARRKLHRALVVMAEAMARDGSAQSQSLPLLMPSELRSLLALRQMFSAYRGGLISAGEQRPRLSWALEVAAAELSLLLENPVLAVLPPQAQTRIRDLSARVTAWALSDSDPVLGRSLYREAALIPVIGSELSTHPLLLEHDEQALSELSALLANEPSSALLEHEVLGRLHALRGLDADLDRLELNLIYGAKGVLGALSLRASDLRAKLSRPVRSAASWS